MLSREIRSINSKNIITNLNKYEKSLSSSFINTYWGFNKVSLIFLSASLHFSDSVREMGCQYFKPWQNGVRETVNFEQHQPYLFLSELPFSSSLAAPLSCVSVRPPKDNHALRAGSERGEAFKTQKANYGRNITHINLFSWKKKNKKRALYTTEAAQAISDSTRFGERVRCP